MGVRPTGNDPSGPLPTSDVRDEADRDRRGVRRASVGRAFALVFFILAFVVLFALEFQLVLACLRACLHSLTVFQHLDRR